MGVSLSRSPDSRVWMTDPTRLRRPASPHDSGVPGRILLRWHDERRGVPLQRRYVLAAISLALLVVAGLVLHQVLGTVFLAITVAYLLVPVQRRLRDRDVPEWWAATAVTAGATVAAIIPIGIAGYLAVVRLSPVLGFLNSLPESVIVTVFGFEYTVVLADVVVSIASSLRSIALAIAGDLPVLSLKLTLFAILVFALLVRHDEAEAALVAPVPREYRDVVWTLGHRARETLYAIYVLQAATATGTFLIALPVFLLLGLDFPFTLAFIAAVLQFIPIVGPSLLIAGLAIWAAAVGDVTGAILIVVLGGFFVAWLPDVLIRPRLSQRTARLPGSLYFIGFIGGLLTVGPIGVVAGPLAIALAVSAMDMLAEAENSRQTTLS